MKLRARLWIAGALAGLALTANAGFGETLWIKSASAVLRQGKAAVYPPVVTLPQGTQVNGITHDSGWVQVTAGSATGWLSESSVSSSKVNAPFNMPGNNAEMNTGAAARGLEPGAEDYVRTRRVSKAGLESLIALRNNIGAPEWIAFIKDVHK